MRKYIRKLRLPFLFYNWTSLAGTTLALISLSMIVFLLLISLLIDPGTSYLGLFIYIILPVFLVSGLALIPLGMMVKSRK